MISENNYIYKKEVDWSLLQQGLSIPVSLQVQFQSLIHQTLPRGTTISIQILIDGQLYPAKLTNQRFNEQKYPTHKDIVQIRYEPNSVTAQKMRSIFSTTYEYCMDYKQQIHSKKKSVIIPTEKKEFLVLYTTTQPFIFLAESITETENQLITNELSLFSEEAFELETNYSQEDLNATVEQRNKLVKIRKLDKSICDNLKKLYNHRCQMSGENFAAFYGVSVVEAHHIDYFTKSLNNNSDNILIVSPNYHRLIHKLNPSFDRISKCFVFPNGYKDVLKLNYHL